ncbi:hypothetical protein HNR46_001873 [Haloferula luteola]|uniref:Uncharacterized protein n=1 Tax=Haloferula luteola TaxID=595692 RepID=A0A840V7S0_9BACT|nr:hypothetical protein [Haloferula luteola]MBB5351634.1 hypothetical protein [Haloferula luteola]
MFKRVIYEEWSNIIPMIAFGIMFTVFLVTTIRAIRLRPVERERLSTLPLDEETGHES